MSDDKQLAPVDEQLKIRQSFDVDTHKTMLAISDRFHKAGCFAGNIKNAEQAFAIIQAGYEMGIQPMEAVNSFYIVNGKITIYGTALSKRLRMHGWRIQVGKHDESKCEVTIKKGDEEYSYTATKEEVIKLGSNAYKKAPKDKLYWHAVSRIVRFSVPEVLGSVSYTHEEMEGNTQFVDVEPVVETEEKQMDMYDHVMKAIDGMKTWEEYEGLKDDIISNASLMSDDKRSLILSTLEEKVKQFAVQKDKEEQEIDQETGEVKEDPAVANNNESVSAEQIPLVPPA